jgi:thiamine biosynthesis lipoprotein
MPSLSSSLRRARPLLGTFVEIRVDGNPRILSAAVDEAFAAIARVHQLMSFHDPESDVSRLNQEAYRQPVKIDPQTWVVLDRARCISEASNGAFDITVAPRLVQWGYLPESILPLPALKPNGYRAIELLMEHHVRFCEPTLIDLGGIAKGYAVDVACVALERWGVYDYVVNAGGDLRVGGTATPIHVRHPRQPMTTLVLGIIQGAAIATSATYFARKSTHHDEVHPIVAPTTIAPAQFRGSISVRAPDCMTADALTKVVAVLGSSAAPTLQRLGAEAFLLSEAGEWRRLPDGAQSSNVQIERDARMTAGS